MHRHPACTAILCLGAQASSLHCDFYDRSGDIIGRNVWGRNPDSVGAKRNVEGSQLLSTGDGKDVDSYASKQINDLVELRGGFAALDLGNLGTCVRDESADRPFELSVSVYRLP